MQVNEENLLVLRNYLEQTLNPNTEVRRNAEKFIASVGTQQGFPILVLQLLEKCTQPQDEAIRQAGAILFKNFVKKHWDTEKEETTNFISEQERATIKTHIVSLMCSVPGQIQKQLSAALSTIVEYDFPHKWENLLPELVSKFHSDWFVVNGVLLTANTIFKRFRYVFKSDELFTELKHCLTHFQQPLLDLFKFSGKSLTTCGNDIDQLRLILNAMRSMCRIFFSLNWQDLPEFFEDHMPEWMKEFENCLKYDNVLLNDPDEEDEPSPLDTLQGAIVANLNLYAEKYEDEFRPYLKGFTEIIWTLLSSKISSCPKHDILAATCMKFLRVVSFQSKLLFKEKETLSQICTNIVVKNLQLRTSDEELFEDNPMDYIRRDIEGSDGDTRRSAARELVRGLLRHFDQPVTEICMGLITNMLQQYASNPVELWGLKDVSINLVIALAVRKQSRAKGVSELNPLVPIMDFFTTHILPELADPNSSAKILKADAIRCVSDFRSQLSLEMMKQVMPMLVRLLLPDYFVVHTYAASCIERILTVKDIQHDGSSKLRFDRNELAPFLPQILQGIFSIMEQPNYPENDYLMKTIMRVINVAKEDIIPVTDTAVSKLTNILKKICANPSNPIFSHYLFESISVLVLNVCKSNPAATEQFENLLFPPFQNVLAADVEVLCPYVYQVLAQLLVLRPQGISQAYLALFPVLLNPNLWETVSNVTALVKLIEAYLKKAPSEMAKYIPGILGVFQKLISARATESSGFSMLRCFFCYIPLNVYVNYTPEIFKILMLRLQSRMGGRMGILYIKELLYTLSIYIGKHGPIPFLESIEKLQQGMGKMLLTQVWIPNLLKVKGTLEQKTCAIGLTRILCEVSHFTKDMDVFGKFLFNIMELLEGNLETPLVNEDDDSLLELEETGYEAGFSKLHFASPKEVDYLNEIPSAKRYLAEMLSNLSKTHPGCYPVIAHQVLEPKRLQALEEYFRQTGVNFQ